MKEVKQFRKKEPSLFWIVILIALPGSLILLLLSEWFDEI